MFVGLLLLSGFSVALFSVRGRPLHSESCDLTNIDPYNVGYGYQMLSPTLPLAIASDSSVVPPFIVRHPARQFILSDEHCHKLIRCVTLFKLVLGMVRL